MGRLARPQSPQKPVLAAAQAEALTLPFEGVASNPVGNSTKFEGGEVIGPNPAWFIVETAPCVPWTSEDEPFPSASVLIEHQSLTRVTGSADARAG